MWFCSGSTAHLSYSLTLLRTRCVPAFLCGVRQRLIYSSHAGRWPLQLRAYRITSGPSPGERELAVHTFFYKSAPGISTSAVSAKTAISPGNTLHPPTPLPPPKEVPIVESTTAGVCVCVRRWVKGRICAFPVYSYPYIWFNIHECTWLAQQVGECWVCRVLRRRCITQLWMMVRGIWYCINIIWSLTIALQACMWAGNCQIIEKMLHCYILSFSGTWRLLSNFWNGFRITPCRTRFRRRGHGRNISSAKSQSSCCKMNSQGLAVYRWDTLRTS